MAEPTLLQTFDEIRLDVAQELGYTRTESKWSAEQTAEVNNITNTGYRRFLFLAITQNGAPYRWSFLQPVTTLNIWSLVTGTTVGVPTFDGTNSTVTATASKFYPSMLGKSFVFTTSGQGYTILSYTSPTVIVVSGDASSETSGDTFSITGDGDFQLPDDFGGAVDDFYILNANNRVRRITRRSSSQILRYRADRVDDTDTPEIYAIAPLTMDGANVGQRQKVMFYPIPDADLELTYQYSILPDALTTANPYPKGAEIYSETIKYAALAEVERRIGKQRGYEVQYQQYLAISVQQDALAAMPDSLGYNSDDSVRATTRFYDRTYGATITRNGSPI